jgi:ribosomal-protein-alanine N-acetyltransferase
MITTANLILLPCERIHIEAILRDKRELATLLNLTIPNSWPQFPEAFALPADTSLPSATDWAGYFFTYPQDNVLIGNGGFNGEPDEAGSVEIGYEIAPDYWNRGFATEAARGLIDYAFAHEQVQSVIAHTLPYKNASGRVLQKVGMKFDVEVSDPEDGNIWRWKITRHDYCLA